jgi:hypothetical protein
MIANMRYIVVLVYLVLMTAWIYGAVANEPSDVPPWLVLPLVVAIQVGLGFALGRWWVSLVPLALFMIAIPAGYGNGEGDIPVWVGVIVMSTVAVPLVAAGVAMRQAFSRGARGSRRAPGSAPLPASRRRPLRR